MIAAVVDKVRRDSVVGGFVKKDPQSNLWYEIGDDKARDKVGHAIRRCIEENKKRKSKSRDGMKRMDESASYGSDSSVDSGKLPLESLDDFRYEETPEQSPDVPQSLALPSRRETSSVISLSSFDTNPSSNPAGALSSLSSTVGSSSNSRMQGRPQGPMKSSSSLFTSSAAYSPNDVRFVDTMFGEQMTRHRAPDFVLSAHTSLMLPSSAAAATSSEDPLLLAAIEIGDDDDEDMDGSLFASPSVDDRFLQEAELFPAVSVGM